MEPLPPASPTVTGDDSEPIQSTTTGMMAGRSKPAPLRMTELEEPSDPLLDSSPVGAALMARKAERPLESSPVGAALMARKAERPLLQKDPPLQGSMARPDGGCDSPELSAATEGDSEPAPPAATEGDSEPAPSAATEGDSEPVPSAATGGDSEPVPSAATGGDSEPVPLAATGGDSEPVPSVATGDCSEPTPLTATGGYCEPTPWRATEDDSEPTPLAATRRSDSEQPALSAVSAARRLSRIEAALIGLDDAATFVRPWAALHAVQRGACATAQRRIAQHTELVLQADAAVLTKTLAALHADVRGIAAIQVVDSASVAHRACIEQFEQQHQLLKAAASEDQALAAQSEERIVDIGARVSLERTARSESLRAAATQAGTHAAEQAASARDELHAATAQASQAHGERRARVAAALAGAERQLVTEEARLASGQERLRAAATSARELGRRREEGHAAALNHLRQPVVAALGGMKKAAVSGKLQMQREQLEQEIRAVQRQSRVQHLCWLRSTSELLSDGVRTIGAHLDAAEAEQREAAPLGAGSQRREARIEALSARIERLKAEVHSF